MTEVLLIGWGRTDWSDAGRLEGITDLPLNPAGRESVAALAESLRAAPPDDIFHGPEEAARETARRLGGSLGIRPHRAVKDLHELNLGLWQGLRREEIEQRFTSAYEEWRVSPESVAPPEGEPVAEAAARLRAAALRRLKRRDGRRVALVVGPMAAAMLRGLLTDGTLSAFWEYYDAAEQVARLNWPPLLPASAPAERQPAEPVATTVVGSALDAPSGPMRPRPASSAASSGAAAASRGRGGKRQKEQGLQVEHGVQGDGGQQRTGPRVDVANHHAEQH